MDYGNNNIFKEIYFPVGGLALGGDLMCSCSPCKAFSGQIDWGFWSRLHWATISQRVNQPPLQPDKASLRDGKLYTTMMLLHGGDNSLQTRICLLTGCDLIDHHIFQTSLFSSFFPLGIPIVPGGVSRRPGGQVDILE